MAATAALGAQGAEAAGSIGQKTTPCWVPLQIMHQPNVPVLWNPI